MKVDKYKSRQTSHKPLVLTAPADRAEKVSMSRIKETVFGAFWGPGGPIFFLIVISHNCWKLAGRFSMNYGDELMLVW